MRTPLSLRSLLLILALALHFSARANDRDYAIIELPTDTLPSLNMPRTGHVTLCLDGELTVFGGHTDGFIPTATAEYLRDGVWHTVPLAYPHDHATAIRLRSGKVFLAGGHKEPLGIDQLFSVEMYDPKTHTSQGFGCMDKKRAYANAIEMNDGQVVISGNWFADDGIEMFDNVNDPFKPNAVGIKDVSIPRVSPYILRISDDDAIIFSTLSNKCEQIDSGILDRLKGPSYHEPFLDTWCPIPTIEILRSYNQFIGNEAEGSYEWLVPVKNGETGQVAIARVKGIDSNGSNPSFSLLQTLQPVPDSIHGKEIVYSSLVCDRERGLSYLIGDNDEARIFVVAFPHNSPAPAKLTIYATKPQPIIARGCSPVLTPEGDLVFAGGHLINNFSPSSSVIRLPLGQTSNGGDSASSANSGRLGWWLWTIIFGAIACAIGVIIIFKAKKPKESAPREFEADETHIAEDADIEQNLPKEEILSDLLKRIEQLMEHDELYLNANLRASDVAAKVGSNTAYVSAAINSQRGCSFSQFLIKYRISHAQELMRRNPDSKISTISALSGFSSDSTFFRVFRAATGMSPKEWLSSLHRGQQS